MWSKEGKEKISDAAKRGRERTHEEAAARYYENPNTCLFCEKVIELNGQRPSVIKLKKFCNQSCAAKYNNVKFPKRKTEDKICLNCGGIIKNRNSSKYCSLKCDREYRHKQSIIKFYNGQITDIRLIRKILKELRGERCEDCLNTIWKNTKIPLEVDHIDGNHKNNYPDNLRLLCPNCHALTDTYKNKNKGKGRSFRRERYAQGKSY